MSRIKRAAVVLAVFLLGAVFTGCLSVRYVHSIGGLDVYPPYDNRFEAAPPPPEIYFYLPQFDKKFFQHAPYRRYPYTYNPVLIINRRYEILQIHEMKCETGTGKKGILVKDLLFKKHYRYRWYGRGWWTKNGFFWPQWLGELGYFFEIENIQKLFPGIKEGDEFLIKIILTYSFDDEPAKTLEYELRGEIVRKR